MTAKSQKLQEIQEQLRETGKKEFCWYKQVVSVCECPLGKCSWHANSHAPKSKKPEQIQKWGRKVQKLKCMCVAGEVYRDCSSIWLKISFPCKHFDYINSFLLSPNAKALFAKPSDWKKWILSHFCLYITQLTVMVGRAL